MKRAHATKRPFLVGNTDRDDRGVHVKLMTGEPQPCPGCKTMHTMFINRMGATLCLDCDAKEKP